MNRKSSVYNWKIDNDDNYDDDDDDVNANHNADDGSTWSNPVCMIKLINSIKILDSPVVSRKYMIRNDS